MVKGGFIAILQGSGAEMHIGLLLIYKKAGVNQKQKALQNCKAGYSGY